MYGALFISLGHFFNASFIAKAEEKKPDTPVEKKDDSKPAVDPSKKDSAGSIFVTIMAKKGRA